jgi:hypothetical protein
MTILKGIFKLMTQKTIAYLSKQKALIFTLCLGLLLSHILYWNTFYIQNSTMYVATKVWSDFGATIPLTRSFTYGYNFPPEYPHFAGAPIRYHFLFYLIVGIIERFGIPLDVSLNTLSSIGLISLLLIIYHIGATLFEKKSVGILAVLLFIFNSSLGFIAYFTKNPLSSMSLTDIITGETFSSFGPYDSGIVSAFWSLNIYTNQRHLALGFAIFLAVFFFLSSMAKHTKRFTLMRSILLGIIVGLLPFLHLVVFGTVCILFAVYFVLFKSLRVGIFLSSVISILIALPQFIYMGESDIETELIHFGYLAHSIPEIPYYWIMNLGLTLILFPIGFYLANKTQRRLAIPFIALFILANVVRLSPEIAANHKLVNLATIGFNWFSALVIIKLWHLKKMIFKPIAITVVFFMTLTGVVDIFPIINDRHIPIDDIPNNKVATFIERATLKDSVFLNSSFIYHPALIAGRKVFLGWPYFSWSAGYDTNDRKKVFDAMYSINDKSQICQLLITNSIDYVTVEDTNEDPNIPPIDVEFFRFEFTTIYDKDNYLIIPVSGNCN